MKVTKSERLLKELFSFSNELHQKVVQAHQAHSSFVGRGKILYLLSRNDYVYQNQLAKLAQIKPGSLTQILEKMEREQLIIRERDQADRRLIYVRLSTAGKEQLAQNVKYHRDFQEYVTAPLSDDEMEQFITTLGKIKTQFNKYVDQHNETKEMNEQ